LTAFAGTADDRLFAALTKRQIDEPAEELRLRDTIPVLTPIEDAVSTKVRAQYEENPYPRWLTAQSIEARPLDVVLKDMFPFLTAEDVKQPAAPDVLVAGCGSGHHAMLCANRFLGARILAVDLSLTSLAYGSRKAREAGIAAIDFAQADLLELGRLKRAFNLVACSGVLHHLAD
jgi:2-polyprenyl-3-methyl-5-hydroxy-6-metoxy-1,4-benzoquinol methylase